MRSRTLIVLPFLVAFATAALALLPPSRPQVLLLDARTPAELRETLTAFGDSAAASADPGLHIEAGEAFAVVGQSWSRAGERDSAIAAFRRAMDLRGNPEDVLTLVDEMLLRRTRPDLDAAIAVLEGQGGMRLIGSLRRKAERDGRLAWARFVAGDTTAARALEPEVVTVLSERPEWADRLGRLMLGAGNPAGAYRLLVPVAIDSRLHDRGTLARLRAAADRVGRAAALDAFLQRELAARDSADERAIVELRARRLSFRGDDGAPLGGIATGLSATRRRAAIVLLSHDVSFRSADSLAAQLQRAGLVALFVDPRGTRRSASPATPSPRAWAGRESEFQWNVARDVKAALRALARATPLDTTRYVIAGVGEMTAVAVGAAWLDPRASALLLVSPAAVLAERGPMRAALAALKRPVYLQIAPEEFDASEYANRLADACDPRLVRVADSAAPGRGVEIFRADAIVGRRFADWLRDQWPKPAPASARRPASTRRR